MRKKTTKNAINTPHLFQKLFFLLPIGIVGNLIFVYLTSEHSILTLMAAFKIKYIIFCLILSVFPWLTHSLRVFVWARFMGKNLKFYELLKVVIMNELGAAASPTAIGGGPFKFSMLTRLGFNAGQALSITILGSIEDYTFWILSIPVAIFFAGRIKLPFIDNLKAFTNSWNHPIVLLILLVIVILFILNKLRIIHFHKFFSSIKVFRKIGSFFQRTFQDFKHVYRSILGHGKLFFILNMIFTSLQWIGKFSILIALVSNFNLAVRPLQFFFWQWVVFVTLTFIPTPGAAGGAEATFYFIFKNFIPNNYIGIITIAWRFFTYYSNLMIGTIVLFLMKFFRYVYERFFLTNSIFIVEVEENLTTTNYK